MSALFGGVVLMTTATVAASTMGTLVAGDVAGPALSGVPNAAGVLGTAIGTTWLSVVVTRHGRRSGLLVGYVCAMLGAVTAAAGAGLADLLLLIPGMVLLGIGNGAAQLGRYVAGDLYPPDRRSAALGVIVWGGTAGALAGPALITVSDSAAGRAGLPPAVGPYLLALTAAALGVVITGSLVGPGRGTSRTSTSASTSAERITTLLRLPMVAVALSSMIAGQVAMVAVMTMTPLEMHISGHGLGSVSAILTAHMIGMFALSPLTGRITGRFGGVRTAFAGLITLAVSALAACTAPGGVDSPVSFVALFLLGYGWNLTFIGGSSLLSARLPEASRTRLQGAVDGLAWTASALASIGAGLLMAASTYTVLAAVVAVALIVPATLIVVAARRGVLVTQTP
jgi:MFS family permease